MRNQHFLWIPRGILRFLTPAQHYCMQMPPRPPTTASGGNRQCFDELFPEDREYILTTIRVGGKRKVDAAVEELHRIDTAGCGQGAETNADAP